MLTEITRAVTGQDSNGKAIFTHAEVVPPITAELYPGATYWLVWGTEDGQTVGRNDDPVHDPFFPGPGGTRALLVRFAPNTAAGEGAGSSEKTPEEVEEMHRDAEAKFPGLFALHAADPINAAFHTSDSIDYCFVIEGEIWRELDNGREERFGPGSAIVERGSRHAWINKSDEPALVFIVITGAARVA